MKIALVARMFDIKKNAGLGRVSMEVKTRLIERGYEVVPIESKSENLTGYFKYVMWGLPRQLPKADVYIACTPMESIWLPKNKSIAIVHDLIPLVHPKCAGARMNDNPFTYLASKYMYWLGAYNAAKCARIITNSEMTKYELVKYFKINPAKVQQINLGIRPDLDYEPKKDKTFRLGYLGQMDKRKRVDLLINAFKQSDIKGELVLAGNGIDRPQLEALAGSDSRIKFLGFVPDDKLCDFYNSLDLFVFPSACEGWGLPITEAFACNKPVMVCQDAIIPPEIKDKCLIAYGNKLTFQRYHDAEVLHDNYNFAHSLSWDSFVDGLENTIKEVSNGEGCLDNRAYRPGRFFSKRAATKQRL